MRTEDSARIPALSLALVEQRLKGRVAARLPREGLTRAAVLVLLREGPGGLEVLLTRRSHGVRDHKGQVSFPGGVAEPGDRDEVFTALREAAEEVGLDPGSVRVVGRLDDYVTITGYHVTPIVAFGPFEGLSPRTGEIAEVFAFPLSFMADDSRVERVPGAGMGRSEDILFVEFGERLVWGATARMLYNLLEVLR